MDSAQQQLKAARQRANDMEKALKNMELELATIAVLAVDIEMNLSAGARPEGVTEAHIRASVKLSETIQGMCELYR